MIEVEGLTKFYGPVRAIEDVTFRVEKGEIVGFLGPNGAGKTTTMRILACFMPPTQGRAVVAGYDVLEQPLEVRRRVGYLPENVPLYPDMTVTGYLQFVAEVKGVPRRLRKQKIEEVLEACGATEMAGRLISRLSKGYRQRVGLCQALLNDPEVLILDEPTIGLDPRQIIEIRQLIKDLGAQRTIILSTHILPEVSMTCQRVIIINEGRIVAVDTPGNLQAGLQKGAQLVLQVRGPAEAVERELRRVAGVVEVRRQEARGDGVCSFVVECDRGAEVQEELAAAVVRNQWGLRELRATGLTLEDVFIRLVTHEAHEEEAAA
ncbi:MAG: ATP-binding cassette domain-containing protein [Deltaproteobacteria bacterium]|nr:ATP-binding cassette domain-containing protein [Deltaproteobacteria bacterium]MBI3075411.1 ATP-binding cassette domain-containing protein [Deltaproteobacteria bacterium]